MDTQFQDLEWVTERAEKQFARNKKSSVSALFRTLRRNRHFQLFGDYSILWAIGEAMRRKGIPRERTKFWYAAKSSKEYREANGTEKRWWLNTLCPPVKK